MHIGEEKRVRERTTLVYKEKKRTGREWEWEWVI